ncbi:hypothetical protein EIP86_003720 [Pleurotus ostreatoroseus]|nr:hypothetical protein EIP86_003720 [Pleurotus ostreatoroseus]
MANELIQSVLEMLYYDEKMRPNYPALTSAALVCRAWRNPAQQLLFRNVELSTPLDLKHLGYFLSVTSPSCPRGLDLASLVRQVDLILTYTQDPQILVQLVSRCHRLYDVTLRVVGVHALDDDTLEGLRQAHTASMPTPIRSLSLMMCGVQSPLLYQLLSVWPTIRFPRLGAELAAPLPAQPTQVQLYELILHRTLPPRVMEWLLRSSVNSLRIFDCHAAPSTEYDPLVAQFSENLLSLRLFRHMQRSMALIRRCPNLRELVITQLSSFLPLGELPMTLEHLSFRSLSTVTTIPLTPIISAVDKLPRLRLLTCDASTEQNPDFAVLREKCEKKGIFISSGLRPIPMVSVVSIAPDTVCNTHMGSLRIL